MSDKTNVLYLDHTAKLGGGELALLSLTVGLKNSRYRPIVVLASDGPLASKLRLEGIETYMLPLSADIVETRKGGLGAGSLLKVGKLLDVAVYCYKVSRLAKKLRVRIIHTNSLKSDVYGAVAGFISRIPVVWHVRDHITADYLPNSVARAFRWMARWMPSAILANSASTLEALKLDGRKSAKVAYSGVDEALLDRPVVRMFDSKKPVVTLVGRITEWKGQHVFIEAAVEVVKRYPAARFLIVGAPLFGEVEYERSLQRMVRDLSLESHVQFLGFRDDVVDIIEGSDIIVHASCTGEPFGQVIVQGMAAAKPVIASDGGALTEVVAAGVTGMLTPMGDSKELAKAIIALCDAPDVAAQMGAAGRDRVRRLFTMSRTLEAVTEIYQRIDRRPVDNSFQEPVLLGS